MTFTRENLRQMYIIKQESDIKNTIDKIVSYMKNSVLDKAVLGEVSCKEFFPNSINQIKDEILENLKLLFPDSIIKMERNDDQSHYPYEMYILINWDL